jgi:hypothetical protein
MRSCLLLFVLLAGCWQSMAQNAPPLPWHEQERGLHYRPDADGFVRVSGTRKFNRALYGGNSAFRVEAGDLPEFALYLPGMGGNLQIGIRRGEASKWLSQAAHIETRYEAGAMTYIIQDPILGGARLKLQVQATYRQEGLIAKLEAKDVPANTELLLLFGGVSGRKFSRDGDIGADPESSFYLKPEYCRGNLFDLKENGFSLYFGSKLDADSLQGAWSAIADTAKAAFVERSGMRRISAAFPKGTVLRLCDATQQGTPNELLKGKIGKAPVLVGTLPLSGSAVLFLQINSGTPAPDSISIADWSKEQETLQKIRAQVKISTPDPWVNTLGGTLAVAADAIWEDPSYMHGAVAWRMRLNGWRGPYVADVLGWHDRARSHLAAYAQSQVTAPATGPVIMDTALHLARGLERMGTSVYSSGYISRNPGGDQRPHHYDMNLVYIDQLLDHLNWTGDTVFLRSMWPVLARHLDWEKRNFDRDGDGLYDAYAAIWASDALQYSGGGVTHSSAYNFRANHEAARLATLVGADPEPYRKEAAKVLAALNRGLWLRDSGWYAEYKDLLGAKRLHPAAGLWSIYHPLEAGTPDPFQAWQLLRYVDHHLPHIPIRAKGLADTSLQMLATTSWQPYTWSLNNVALAEQLHAALGYWQGGDAEEAYRLWKSALVESMYLGASPGNFQQLSFYDAERGELYRDFADGIGMAGRSLVEGLFGIRPMLLENKLGIRPGFPSSWKKASLHTPDIDYHFERKGLSDHYTFDTRFHKAVSLELELAAISDGPVQVLVNGKPAQSVNVADAVGRPMLRIIGPKASHFDVSIRWSGSSPEQLGGAGKVMLNSTLHLTARKADILRVNDPQGALSSLSVKKRSVSAMVGKSGWKTVFLQLRQGLLSWWEPVDFFVQQDGSKPHLIAGGKYEPILLDSFFNEDLNRIFHNEYLSPRPLTTTLQLPTTGIGNWAYPNIHFEVNDSGLRSRAGAAGLLTLHNGVPLATPGRAGKNIVFTSQWTNFPQSLTIPLSGNASGAWLLLAGSTNPMQSQMDNGLIEVAYMDGSRDTLALRNPENWWPIEQDMNDDGFAFRTGASFPTRIDLLSGTERNWPGRYSSIKGFSNRAVEGGAATVLSLPLDEKRKLKSITLRATANDVLIGLMSLTLQRP